MYTATTRQNMSNLYLPPEIIDKILGKISDTYIKKITSLRLVSSLFNGIILNNKRIIGSLDRFKKLSDAADYLIEKCCVVRKKYLNVPKLKRDLMESLKIFEDEFEKKLMDIKEEYKEEYEEYLDEMYEEFLYNFSDPIFNIVIDITKFGFGTSNACIEEEYGDFKRKTEKLLCKFIGINSEYFNCNYF